MRLCLRQTAVAAFAAVVAAGAAPETPWAVPSADVRFELTVAKPPSHPSAGLLVTLPDGGLLPRPGPEIAVLDGGGRPLPHGTLWHDPARGLTLVIGVPEAGPAMVYAQRGPSPRAWREDSGLTPSVIAIVQHGGQGIADAERLAGPRVPGKDAYLIPLDGIGLGALPQGLSGRFSDYILGYVVPPKAGETWIAPLGYPEAEMDVYIDDRKLSPQRRSARSGGMGRDYRLDKTPQKVHFFSNRPSEEARVQVAWAPPGTTLEELGGESTRDRGKPMWDARPILSEECLHSGEAAISRIERRDGAPVAAFQAVPQSYFWLADKPAMLYRLEARTAENPKSASYAWTVQGLRSEASAPQLLWLLEGDTEATIKLAVQGSPAASECTQVFRCFCPGTLAADINSEGTRQLYLDAFFNMVAGCPAGENPLREWAEPVQDLFWRLLEPGEGQAVLGRLFKDHWDAICDALPPERLAFLQDLFFVMACPTDPVRAEFWADTFVRHERDLQRKQMWKLRHAELLMYYLDDLARAEEIVKPMAGPEAGEIAALATIRLGDIALLGGRADDATRLYGDAQDRARHLLSTGKTAIAPQRGLTLSKDEARAEAERRRDARKPSALDRQVKDWKAGAIRETADAETVRTFIRQGYLADALAALREWEREFPLGKLSGDFILAEAVFYMDLKDYRRAMRGLKAYVHAVDVGGYLPKAVGLYLQCVRETRQPDKDFPQFVADIKKRLPYHPVSQDAVAVLQELGGGGGEGAP